MSQIKKAQCVPLSSDLSVFAIKNGYSNPGIFSNEINFFILYEGKTPIKFPLNYHYSHH